MVPGHAIFISVLEAAKRKARARTHAWSSMRATHRLGLDATPTFPTTHA